MTHLFLDKPLVPAHSTRGLDRNRRLTRRPGLIGRWIVKTQTDYRKLAEDCVRLAQTATEVHRAMLLNMASTWLHFADRAARDDEWIVNDHAARNDKHP